MYRFGPLQKKILVALLGSVALGTSHTPKQYFRTLKIIGKDWKRIDRYNFNRSVERLSRVKLLEEKQLSDGSFKLVLTADGKREARKLSLIGTSIKFKKPRKWDNKWRIVIFDIPEKDRDFRNVLREHLKELRFYKLQQSVFISPYPFEKSIAELTRLYSVGRYVRIITATSIDNEKRIRNHFFKDAGKN